MKCNKCHHDTLFVEVGKDGLVYIKCNNCDLTISTNKIVNSTEELILYNINMSEVYAEGKRDFIEGKEMKDNPHFSSFVSQDSSVWWAKGWTDEKQEMTGVSNFLSAKKEIDGKLENLQHKFKDLSAKEEGNSKNYSAILDLDDLVVKLLTELNSKNYWFGGAYRDDISEIMQAISDFCEERDLTL